MSFLHCGHPGKVASSGGFDNLITPGLVEIEHGFGWNRHTQVYIDESEAAFTIFWLDPTQNAQHVAHIRPNEAHLLELLRIAGTVGVTEVHSHCELPTRATRQPRACLLH